jgi:hypothetical protein
MLVKTKSSKIHTRKVNLLPLIKDLFPKVGTELNINVFVFRLAQKVIGNKNNDCDYIFHNDKELSELSHSIQKLLEEQSTNFQIEIRITWNYEDCFEFNLVRTK